MVRRSENRAFSGGSLAVEPGSGVSLGIAGQKPLLVCLSHLRWDFVWQRPQHLLSRAARDFRVVVFEEPMWRDGIASPQLEVTRREGGIRVAVPMLPAGTDAYDAVIAQRRLLERFLATEPGSSRVFWYYTPMAVAFAGHLPADAVIYDNMDELSAFAGASPELLANEEDLFARADLVFTGGLSLFEAKRGRHPSVHPFPSSIEAQHFSRARTRVTDPADQAPIPHPRLGFFGVIDERMDLDLVQAVAEARPDWQLVMIGPAVKIDPASLPQRPNIHWLGPKKYDELPAYLSGWDVGFMPFALNESTRFISPTKTPEFLAAGVPVVSTPITDVIRPYGQKNLVEIAADAGQVVAAAERLMARPKAPWLQRVDRQLATGSWDATWSAMRRLIANAMGEPEGVAASPAAGSVAAATIAAE